MKILRIHVYPTAAIQRTRHLIKVETDDGLFGWGECYMVGPDAGMTGTIDYVTPWFVGEDPTRIEFLMMRAHQQFRFPPGSFGMAAVSGIEHALWDIAGKAAGLPVYRLLGGHVRDRVRIYRSLDGVRTAAQAAEAARTLHAQCGVRAFKLSPFLRDPLEDRWGLVCRAAGEFFQELRALTPPDWEFAFDPHAKIFEPIQAVQLAQALAPGEPLFFEEPLRPENRAAWERLRPQIIVPIATGECLYGRFEFHDLLSRQVVDIIQPDVCLCGGLSEMRKIADLAAVHYVTVAPHNPMGPIATAVNLHFAAATANFHILEYVDPRGSGADHWVKDPYLPRDGYLELRPNRPGLGIEVDEEAVRATPPVEWVRRAPLRRDGSTGYI